MTTFVGNTSDLVELWKMTLEHNPKKLEHHPALDLIKSKPESCIPIRVWGDDAPLGKRGRGIRAVSWSSASVVGESIRCKMPIFAIDNRHKNASTDDMLMEIAAWSFNVLLSGCHPATNHAGRPWAELPDTRQNRQRAANAGKPLVPQDYTAVWYELGGDWDYLSEEMRAEQDMHHTFVCLFCRASKLAGPLNYSNAAVEAECFQPLNRRTHQEYMDGQVVLTHGRSPLPPLCNIMGFTIFSLCHDFVHDDLLGVRASLLGSALYELCKRGVFGSPGITSWRPCLNAQLVEAYNQFCDWKRHNAMECSQQRWHAGTLSLENQSSWPCLKTKAHNCGIVSLWLYQAARLAADPLCDQPHSKLLVNTLAAFAQIWCIGKAAPPWFSPEEAADLERARLAALQGYNVLSQSCKDRGIYHYEIRPKLHKLDELLRLAVSSRRNFMAQWTMSDEDWIGRMTRLAMSTHARTMSQRVVARWIVHITNEFHVETTS